MKMSTSPARQWKPLRSKSFAAAAFLFAFLAFLKSAALIHWLMTTGMLVSDVPKLWVLGSQGLPERPFSPVEFVVLRRSMGVLQSTVTCLVFVVAYLVSSKRGRTEATLVAYCLELEEAVERSASEGRLE